jgi:hypothetical protein
MASGSVKGRVNCAADSSDLQISKMNSFVFNVVMKNNRCFCFYKINYLEGKHAFRAEKHYKMALELATLFIYIFF